MTHVMDIGTDLDDLLDVQEGTTDDRGPLVRPMPGLTSPVWYS